MIRVVIENGLQQPSSITALDVLKDDKELKELLMIFINKTIRERFVAANSHGYTAYLRQFIRERYDAMIAKRKTERGKNTVAAKRDRALEFFKCENMSNVFAVYFLIQAAKEWVIFHLNDTQYISTYIETKDGLRPTGDEGYVVCWNDVVVKLVDRDSFSYNNFSQNVKKGWEK